MTKRPGSSSVAALVLSRVAQRRAQENQDPELLAVAKDMESRALASIKVGNPILEPKPEPEAEKPAAFQLRLPG